jgi:hypothetical protein
MRTAYHEEDGKIIVSYEQDVETALKYAHECRAAECTVERIPDLHRTMSVPMVELLKIRNTYGWDFMNKDHWPMVAKILKGPEYAAYRTTNRRI